MSSDKVKTVAIIGAGTMGPGMAAMFASHGFDARLTDIDAGVLERAKDTAEVVFNTLLNAGFLTEAQVEDGQQRLSYPATQADAVDRADFIVEAIPENLEIKQAFFRELEEHVRDDAILASNTSGIPITKLGEACRLPGRLIGMHWSNPPHIIPVVELIRGQRTDDATVKVTHDLTKQVGMIPVEVRRDVPGFVENRILYAIMREALHLLEEGVASPEDIDTVVKWGIGYKLAVIGPLELLDMAGLDIYHSVASYLNADLSANAGVSTAIRDKVEAGELGIKTGRGLFEYQPDEIPALMQRRMRLLLSVKKARTNDDSG